MQATRSVHKDTTAHDPHGPPNKTDDHVIAIRGRAAPDGQKLRSPPSRDNFDFRKSLLAFAMPLSKLMRMKAHVRKTLSVGVVVVRPSHVLSAKGPGAGNKAAADVSTSKFNSKHGKDDTLLDKKEAEGIIARRGVKEAAAGASNSGHQGKQVEDAKLLDNTEAEGIVIRKKPSSTPCTSTSAIDPHAAVTETETEWVLPSAECIPGTDRTLFETVQRCAKQTLGVDTALVQSLLGINTFGLDRNNATHVRFDFLVKLHPTRDDEYRVQDGWEMKWVSQGEVWGVLKRVGDTLRVDVQGKGGRAEERGVEVGIGKEEDAEGSQDTLGDQREQQSCVEAKVEDSAGTCRLRDELAVP